MTFTDVPAKSTSVNKTKQKRYLDVSTPPNMQSHYGRGLHQNSPSPTPTAAL